jgi:enoyl-CoA hydratase
MDWKAELTYRVPLQLGVIPGSGGTQRLTHAIGKSRAMEIVLTGRMFSAQEASDWGLVSRVVSDNHEETLQEAIKVAEKIASKGKISVQAAKEAINHGKLNRDQSYDLLGMYE